MSIEKENIIEMKKEVLSYLHKRGFGIKYQFSNFYVTEFNEVQNFPQEKFYQSSYKAKLNLYFSSDKFFPQEEKLSIFSYLYLNSNIDKDFLIRNINDITDGEWKKDLNKTLNSITHNLEEKKCLLLEFNNSILGLNKITLNKVKEIIKEDSHENKVIFWKSFFEKRKKALNNNKGGTEIYHFLTQNFNKEEIRNNFIELSPYIKDLFETTIQLNVFSNTPQYSKKITFEPLVVEKALKIPGFNKKKIAFELPICMKWIATILGYDYECFNKNKEVLVVLSSNEEIDGNLYKDTIKDYLLFVKNNDGKLLDEKEFSKWYMQNKLEKKLAEKNINQSKMKI